MSRPEHAPNSGLQPTWPLRFCAPSCAIMASRATRLNPGPLGDATNMTVYDLAKDVGIPLGTFAVGMWVEHVRKARAERESTKNRNDDLERAAANAREERIVRVLAAYMEGAKGYRIFNEDGALAAGALELHDWTEVRDFCDRAAERVSSPGDAPIPAVRRGRLQNERLLQYFRLWRERRQVQGASFDVEGLFAELATGAASPN